MSWWWVDSNRQAARLVNYNSLKDDDVEGDPLVTLIGDMICAYDQAPEPEDFYADPPAEWIEARRLAGLAVDVVWKLEKQLLGRRAAGRRWIDHCAELFENKCGLVRYDPLPLFFKGEGRLLLKLHMDDFHGSGRLSVVAPFLENARRVLRLKASDGIACGNISTFEAHKN